VEEKKDGDQVLVRSGLNGGVGVVKEIYYGAPAQKGSCRTSLEKEKERKEKGLPPGKRPQAQRDKKRWVTGATSKILDSLSAEEDCCLLCGGKGLCGSLTEGEPVTEKGKEKKVASGCPKAATASVTEGEKKGEDHTSTTPHRKKRKQLAGKKGRSTITSLGEEEERGLRGCLRADRCRS